jgi:hypothetical protein
VGAPKTRDNRIIYCVIAAYAAFIVYMVMRGREYDKIKQEREARFHEAVAELAQAVVDLSKNRA